MNKLLASLMLIVAGVVGAQNITTLDSSQVYSTSNLVNNGTSPTNVTSTWQNVGLMNQGLPCWAPGDPGCGPQPYFNNGSFNFSYGVTDVYQITNIAAALPNSGTGLRVNGYNYSFTAKNGNGWDGGGLDTLSAYVTFYGSDGKSVRYDYYDLNYQFNWTTFNFSKTFDTPYANKDLSNVRYGFVGGDTSNYWAGPYGPEIYNISFSLNYSVDPCFNNVLSSPSCPGYMDALNKLLPPPPNNSDTVSSTTATPTTTITTTVADDPTNPTVTVVSTPTSTPTAASTTPAASAVSSPAPIATTQKSTNNASSTGTSLGLSVIAKNQQREQSIVSTAVQNAVSSAESSAVASQQEAAAVATLAVVNSTSSSVALTNQFALGTGARLSSVSAVNATSSSQIQDAASQDSMLGAYRNMLVDRTNPLNEYVDQKPQFQSGPVFTGPAVNRNVDNNEAAGGVDIAKIATAPTGYNEYLNFTLRDSAFYAPREVYKNQRNVDNARAYRSLANDRVHQEMIEQQYRR